MVRQSAHDGEFRARVRRLLAGKMTPRRLAAASGISVRQARKLVAGISGAPEQKTSRYKAGQKNKPAELRLRNLVERRLAAFEQLMEKSDGEVSVIDLERQSKALISLMKALEASKAMELRSRASTKEKTDRKARNSNDIRRRLAHHLEGLLAGPGSARPAGDVEQT